MPNDTCEGFFCDPQYIAATIVLVFLAVVAGLIALRLFRINQTRRSRGLEKVSLAQSLDSRLTGRELSVAAAGRLDRDRELQRQINWEREQAMHELMRTGQHIQRQRCERHQRWCYHAFEQDHPPGGFDNPRVPDDWPPDLSDVR